MRTRIKTPQALLRSIRDDLHRAHDFAHERVGFVTAGATWLPDGAVVLLCREYFSVADDDYMPDNTVGAMIGSSAMRKALQEAYRHRSTLIHVHSHGGSGLPDFSTVDLRSAREFVPGFFNALPQMPHGMAVLSNDSARAMLWSSAAKRPRYVDEFIQVGARIETFGGSHGTA